MRRGVDVAHYQGDIDWKTAKANDIDFVMLGTRYRGEVDPLFWQHVRISACTFILMPLPWKWRKRKRTLS